MKKSDILNKNKRASNGNLPISTTARERATTRNARARSILTTKGRNTWLYWMKFYADEILKHRPASSTDLLTFDLSEIEITGLINNNVCLNNSVFICCNLIGAKLTYIDLMNVNMECAQLEQARLSHANFKDANLAGLNLSESVIRFSRFENANFDLANLGQANIKISNF